VAAALAVAVVLVAGVVAWAVSHPPARHQQPPSLVADRPAARASLPSASKPSARVRRFVPARALARPAPLAEARVEAPRLEPLPLVREAPAATYGTRVSFLASPALAAGQARREGKLVLLLHLSGNLEEARFT
jgi:hypothetical protein